MIRLLSDSIDLPTGNMRAFAIDENTALVVSSNGAGGHVGSLIGERGMLVIDLAHANTASIDGEDTFSITGVMASRLSHGDVWDFPSSKLVPASYKVQIKESSSTVPYISTDIFSSSSFEFDAVTSSLISSASSTSYGTTKESNPRFTMRVGKVWSDLDLKDPSVSGLSGIGYGGINPLTGIFETSFANLWISIAAE
jgi:hypothetical protein